MMTRRMFSTSLLAGAAAALLPSAARSQNSVKARNVVLVHGAYADGSWIVLDLDGVTLVDVEAVRFLSTCEKSGTELLHCCPYIREWIIREKDREA